MDITDKTDAEKEREDSLLQQLVQVNSARYISIEETAPIASSD